MRCCACRCWPVLASPGKARSKPRQQHVGRVQDWSYHHVTMSGGLPAADLEKARAEPAFFLVWPSAICSMSVCEMDGEFGPGGRGPRRPVRPAAPSLKIDWSVPLGTGIVAPNMFPAKYSFDINATPSCANDYVVFGLNVAGARPARPIWSA